MYIDMFGNHWGTESTDGSRRADQNCHKKR